MPAPAAKLIMVQFQHLNSISQRYRQKMRRACLVEEEVDAVDRRAPRRRRPLWTEAPDLGDGLRYRTDTDDHVHPDGVPAVAHSCVSIVRATKRRKSIGFTYQNKKDELTRIEASRETLLHFYEFIYS
jgi:hypothetical protein